MSLPPASPAAAVDPRGDRAAPRSVPQGDWIDVPRLLQASRPSAGAGRYLLLLPPLGLAGLLGAVILMLFSPGRSFWLPVMALVSLAASAGALVAMARIATRARQERRVVSEIEELITLRHFRPAAGRLVGLMSRPMRLGPNRTMAMVQLARVLERYGRFEEAIEVAEAIGRDPAADPATRFILGCARAMSMLRAGRLYDAGEAISQLRREVNRLDDAVRRMAERAGEEAADAEVEHDPAPGPRSFDSVALVMVELYRDVQTRHSAEALATVEEKRQALRDGLGMGLADALALGSVAAHRLGDASKAARMWAEATLLMAEDELVRRYPEVREVAGPFRASPRPRERGVA